ncbi:MAG: arginine--tRNA ligase, partial [Bacteroidota bacterium]
MTSPDQPLQTAIQQAFQALYNHTLKVVPLQNTKKEFEGTHTFVTFPYTSPLKKKPDEIAQEVGTYLIEKSNLVEDFNVVKGFLNLHLKDAIWIDIFQQIYRNPDFGQHPSIGKKVVVEYSSPNTNKPLHLGHLRNNFLGYAVAEILKLAGYEVHKTQIINDRGIHICKSMLAYQKFGQQETPASSAMKGDHLVGKYYVAFNKAYKAEINTLIEQGVDKNTATKEAPILKEAQAMLQKWEDNDPEVVALWKKMNGWVYEGFNTTYENIGVNFDSELHESETYLLGKDIIEQALEEGIFYKKENGSIWVDLQEEKLDEKLVLRADGTAVYMTQDIGTAELRYKSLGMDKMIYVVGNEQDWHFKVLFTILKKLGRSYAQDLHHLSYGMVDLPTGKMKSREGTVVDADELVAKVINIAKQRTLELGKIEELNE